MNGYWKNLILTSSIILLSAVGLSLYGYQVRLENQSHSPENNQQALQAQYEQQLQQKASEIFGTQSLKADSIFIQNLTTGHIVYEKESGKALPLASLTKIMTAFVALQHLEPKTIITFSETAIAQTADQGFVVGEQWELQKLIPFMINTSSNDAAFAIGQAITQKTGKSVETLMNETADSLQLESLAFKNPTGLDIKNANGTVATSAQGTARDVAQLFLIATEDFPDVFTRSSLPNLQLGNHTGINTNTLTESLPGFLASKTGYTNTAQGNLAFIVEIGPNQPYIVVLLGSTFDGRFSDAKKIIASLYNVVAETENTL